MPILTEATESLRVAQATEIMQLMASGLTQADACDQVGISPDTYRRVCERNADKLGSFHEIEKSVKAIQGRMILEAQVKVLEVVLNRAIKPDEPMGTKDMLALLKYLDKRAVEVAPSTGATTDEEIKASDYLSGPKLIHAQSKMGGGKSVNVQIDGRKVDITVTDQPEPIDAEFLPDNPEDDQY